MRLGCAWSYVHLCVLSLPCHVQEEGARRSKHDSSQIRTMLDSLITYTSVERIEDAVFKPEFRFKKWYEQECGYSPSAAQAKWDEALANIDVAREVNKAGEVCLPVDMDMVVRGIRGAVKRKELQSTSGCQEDGDLQSAYKKLRAKPNFGDAHFRLVAGLPCTAHLHAHWHSMPHNVQLQCTLAKHCPQCVAACTASSHPGSDAKLAGGSVTPQTKGKDSPSLNQDEDQHMFDNLMDELEHSMADKAHVLTTPGIKLQVHIE